MARDPARASRPALSDDAFEGHFPTPSPRTPLFPRSTRLPVAPEGVVPSPVLSASAGEYPFASKQTPTATASTGNLFSSDDQSPSPLLREPAPYLPEEESEGGTLRTMPGPARKQQYRTSNEPAPSCADLCVDPTDAFRCSLAPPVAPFAQASPASSSDSELYTGTTLPPSPTSSSAGVQLVEDISPNATVLRRPPGQRSTPARNSNAANHTRGKGSISRNQLGTARTMSQRGKKPTRVVKRRIINKIDAKSFFASERTMYSWTMIGSILLGISLNLYGYISIDPDLAQIGLQTGTVLSVLALLIFFYAAYHYLWRRRALSRGMTATAFDDRLGAWILSMLLVAGLGLNIGLAWRSPVGLDVRVQDHSFAAGDRCGLNLHASYMYNPYRKSHHHDKKGSDTKPTNCL